VGNAVRIKNLKITEAEFTRQVLGLAKVHGWRRAHFRPARTAKGWRTAVQGDGVGFPDLVLLRGDTLVVAELKCGNNVLTSDQQTWLRAFKDAGAEIYVWWPEDWAAIAEVLG
jgi:hypothetical protein